MSILGRKRGKYKKSSLSQRLLDEGPTQELLKEMFDFDAERGLLIRKVSRSGKGGRAGSIAGTLNKTTGYVVVRMGAGSISAHRLIWIWLYGYSPENQIDHRNRVRSDNRPGNLREASGQCQARNRTVRRTNTSSVTGVCWSKKLRAWHSTVCKGKGVKSFLCYRADFTEAVCHRYAAEQCLGWHSCDTNSSAYQYLKREGVIK